MQLFQHSLALFGDPNLDYMLMNIFNLLLQQNARLVHVEENQENIPTEKIITAYPIFSFRDSQPQSHKDNVMSQHANSVG